MTTCEPCRRKGKEVTAAKWCVECDEALCPECCDAHRTMKALLTHRVVDIDIAKTASTSGTLAGLTPYIRVFCVCITVRVRGMVHSSQLRLKRSGLTRGLPIGIWCIAPLSTIFQLYLTGETGIRVKVRGMVYTATFNNISVIFSGENRSTRRKLYHILLYRVHLA